MIFPNKLSLVMACLVASIAAAVHSSDLLPCQLAGHDRGWQIDWTAREVNGFVVYQTFTYTGPSRNRVFLEHCKSGRTMRADFSPSKDGPLARHFIERVEGKAKVTQKQLASELKVRGAKTRLWTSRKESCACAVHYPQARGAKKPYVSDR
ncbi:MAG: hypothetical protein AAF393_02155 [Pseudomonadota bacterium]